MDASTLPRPLAPLFNPSVQGFLISLFAQDPARLITQVRVPILIMQGERDLQLSAADAERLRQAHPAATRALLPDTNHVLKTVMTDDRAANRQTDGNAALPLAPQVVETLVRFIDANPAPLTRYRITSVTSC